MVEAARHRSSTRGQHHPHKSTFSRILNDIDIADEYDIIGSTVEESVQYTPSSTSTIYSPPFLPGLNAFKQKPRGNTMLINDIIAEKTTMTREDVASPFTTPPPSLPSAAALVSRTVPSPDGWILENKETASDPDQHQSKSAGASPALKPIQPQITQTPKARTGTDSHDSHSHSTFTARSGTRSSSRKTTESRSFKLNHSKSNAFKYSVGKGSSKGSKSTAHSLIQMESIPLMNEGDEMARLPSVPSVVATKQISKFSMSMDERIRSVEEDSIYRPVMVGGHSDTEHDAPLQQMSVDNSVIVYSRNRTQTGTVPGTNNNRSPPLAPCDEIQHHHHLTPIDVTLMSGHSGDPSNESLPNDPGHTQKTKTPSSPYTVNLMSPTAEDSKVDPERLTELVRSPSVYDQYLQNISLDERQKLLVIVMTKYTILAVTAVLTTQLFVITGVVVAAVGEELEHGHSSSVSELSALEWMFYFMWSTDCAMGSLCCYLNFKMNDPLYHRMCSVLHSGCRNLCASMSKKKIVHTAVDDRAQTLKQYLLTSNPSQY